MAYKIVFDEKLLSCLKISICRIDREETYKTINMVKKSSTSDLTARYNIVNLIRKSSNHCYEAES